MRNSKTRVIRTDFRTNFGCARRRTFARIGVLPVVVAMAIATSAPVFAEVVSTPPGVGTSATVSVALDNDWQFVDSECLFIPILATFGRADDTSILGETTVTKVDSATTNNEGTFLVLPGDPVAGELLDEVFVCPADGTGRFQLDTTIRAIGPVTEESTALDPLTFWVRPATSTMSNVTARTVKGGTRIRGRAQAGNEAATGLVEVRTREPGRKRWSLDATVPIDDGGFATVLDRTLPVGTRVKTTLVRCSWCSRSSATLRVS